MSTAEKSPIANIVEKAKQVPSTLYFLGLINVILFTGLVCQDATIFYLIGLFTFVVLLVSFVGQISGLYPVLGDVISPSVRDRVKELTQQAKTYVQNAQAQKEGSESINTIITVLIFSFRFFWLFT